MKTIILLIILIASAGNPLIAQEFKISKNSGRLEIQTGRVTVEGYNGNEIIFAARDGQKRKDERAQGLREINSLGLEDNTGLGINVEDNGGVVTVRQLKKMESPDIRIQVPKGVIVSFSHESQYGGKAHFRNMENEIEVSAQYNSVELENITGPATIKTIYGHVEATFDQTVKGPISIVSIYGFVDVTIPAATKANLRMSTSYGEIFVAPELKIEMEKSADSDRVNGKLNGGGLSMDLSCNYGKIYLRKK
ncbi:MAG: DUF4097 family beta strand repeat protein [Bacteroidetes bacterium]|nr:DUF4097 family beta strand repeat protein [Bacteroidota bacterium]